MANSSLRTIPVGTELHGVIVRGHGLYYDVAVDGSEGEILRCTLRGMLKRGRRRTDPAAVGDRVRATMTTPETPESDPPEGVIEEIMPRVRALSRVARGTQDVEQVIVANPDQLVAVFAIHEPEPHPRLIDRFLLIAEARGLASIICFNKADLATDGDVEKLAEPYVPAGYPIVTTSVRTGAGIEELKGMLAGKISAFAGPSGVGKSSLLNAIAPERAAERTGEVSQATGKGRHTTTWTTLFRVAPDTWVADTPGIRALRVWGVKPDELDRLYPEFRPHLGECYYADCRHMNEPGCAILAAVEASEIHPARYASYRSFVENDE
ncbi:MAG: ribosome small subunit-dependent GTPase A [Chloroflexota bacterium]|nr:ribosome small subunit-dependent GTPase A [Chloroflexota bacterium]